MRRWLVVLVPLVVLAACSDEPSGGDIEAASAKVSAAPVPEGSSERFELAEGQVAERIGDTNTWRWELCSDGSCPMVLRAFELVTYPTLDEACAAVDAYVAQVGGSGTLTSCPPADAGAGVLVVPDGQFGNTVTFTLSYTTGVDGAWAPGTEASVELGIGQQFCSDSAIAEACAD
ncbi:MAG: hypothetical protein RL238_467 [Actinomycetota bacterium]